ncbi:MAG TPA: cupin domain-containing protein [Candidatus Dormibacteraeota bacterium]|nr:cupin domain-containing protein [Candidatus Dormibacteraeota bacterium]
MAIIATYKRLPFVEGDPDDYRPNSSAAFLVDPGVSERERVEDITFVSEEIAPGDRIPAHDHPVSEVMVIQHGRPEVRLGDERREVEPGTVIFIPARVAHGVTNRTDDAVRIYAMFPTQRIGVRYIERNPAPGTEKDAPQPEFALDMRELSPLFLTEA